MDKYVEMTREAPVHDIDVATQVTSLYTISA